MCPCCAEPPEEDEDNVEDGDQGHGEGSENKKEDEEVPDSALAPELQVNSFWWSKKPIADILMSSRTFASLSSPQSESFATLSYLTIIT